MSKDNNIKKDMDDKDIEKDAEESKNEPDTKKSTINDKKTTSKNSKNKSYVVVAIIIVALSIIFLLFLGSFGEVSSPENVLNSVISNAKEPNQKQFQQGFYSDIKESENELLDFFSNINEYEIVEKGVQKDVAGLKIKYDFEKNEIQVPIEIWIDLKKEDKKWKILPENIINMIKSQQKIDKEVIVKRKFAAVGEDKTEVIMDIELKGNENFILYEKIPKSVAQDINEIEFNFPYIVIEEDPEFAIFFGSTSSVHPSHNHMPWTKLLDYIDFDLGIKKLTLKYIIPQKFNTVTGASSDFSSVTTCAFYNSGQEYKNPLDDLSCSSDDDCKPTEYCSNKKCIDKCTYVKCGENEICKLGDCVCTEGYKNCNDICISVKDCCSDNDCSTGKVCLSGGCVDACVTISCNENEVCEQGECICKEGYKSCNKVCIPMENCCSNDDCFGERICMSGSCVKAGEIFFMDNFDDGILNPYYKEYGKDAEWVEHNNVLEERKVSPHGLNQNKRLIYTKMPIKNFKAKVDFQILSDSSNDQDSYIWWHAKGEELNGIQFGGIGGRGRAFVRGWGTEKIWNEGRDNEWELSKCRNSNWCTWEVILKDNHYTLNLYYKSLGGNILNLKEGDIDSEWSKDDYFIGLGTYHRSEVRFDNFIVTYT